MASSGISSVTCDSYCEFLLLLFFNDNGNFSDLVIDEFFLGK